MRKRFALLSVSALALFAWAAPTLAQTAGQSPNTQQPASIARAIEKKLIMAQPASTKDVSNSEVIPIDLTFKDVRDLPADVSTTGVMIKGYTRYVDVNGRKIGQLVLTGLEKDQKSAELDPETFASQFDFREGAGAQLSSADEIEVGGNREQLIAALRKLNAQELAEGEDGEDGKDGRQDPQKREKGQPSSNASQNEQASNYKTPERLPAPKEPKEEFRTTTEGCKVRVDLTQEIAAQQSRVQHIVDGAIKDEGSCADSGTQFPLKKNYQFCKADVDIEAKRATAHFEWFYTNDQAQYQKASDCQADQEKVFPITEKHGVCPITINVEQKKAIPKSKLVYLGLNGIEEQVRDCSPSTEKPAITMRQNFDSCKIRHDFAAGRSQEMAAWIYEQDGTIFQATPCLDTDVQFTHRKIYKKGGNDICTPVVDLSTNSVTLQSRIEITRKGVSEYISECTPDTGGKLNIQSTTEGCSDPRLFDHDLANEVSYGRKRFYYENPDRIYVSECQKATDLSYQHTRTVSGYSNQDQLKAAYELTTVTIDVGGSPFEVAKSVVLAGAPLVPYEFQETRDDVVNNQYNGCSVTRITAKVEVYKRPDKTEYKKTIGSGTPQGPLDACGTIIQHPAWTLQSQSEWVWNGGSAGPEGRGPWSKDHSRTGTYSGSRTLQREDGAEIKQTAKSTRAAVCHTQTTIPDGSVPDFKYRARRGTITTGSALFNRFGWRDLRCPAAYTGSSVYAWNQAEGW